MVLKETSLEAHRVAAHDRFTPELRKPEVRDYGWARR